MKRIQKLLTFSTMLVFILVSCTKSDYPLSPDTYGISNTASGGGGSANEPIFPEGTMSYNLGCGANNSFGFLGNTLSLDKHYNLHLSNGAIARAGKINGLSALNINTMPTNGWAYYMSCDEGWTYILRAGDKFCGVYVSKILEDGAQIMYCPFTPQKGWNQ